MRTPHIDPAAGSETVVGASVTLRGELTSAGNIQIDGEVTGNVTAQGDVTVGRTGRIKGDISGLNIQISGQVHGKVQAEDKFELRYSGRLKGDVSCQAIEVHEGGYLLGKVVMSDPEAETLEARTDSATPETDEAVEE
jgi:cytoskeletal protein CcmA (bactofilin family)